MRRGSVGACTALYRISIVHGKIPQIPDTSCVVLRATREIRAQTIAVTAVLLLLLMVDHLLLLLLHDRLIGV